MTEPPKISLRWVTVFLASTVYFIAYFLKSSLSVIIVAMVNSTKDPDDDYNTSYACKVANDSIEEPSYASTCIKYELLSLVF